MLAECLTCKQKLLKRLFNRPEKMNEMIGSSAIVEGEYSTPYLISQEYFNRYQEVAGLLSFTDIELLVIDCENGKPISKAMVSIDMLGRTAVCDDHGKVLIKTVLSGSFIVDIIVPGYIAGSKIINFSALISNRITVKMLRSSQRA